MTWIRTQTPVDIVESLEIVTFQDGTDEQIMRMIEAYYSGDLSLSDIQSVWAIGDTRTIHLNAMSGLSEYEVHEANDYDFAIIDFDHDILTTPIRGLTKSLITLSQVPSLKNPNNSGIGYMNSSRTNSGGWNGSERRAWCNSVYFMALPQIYQDNIKWVNKLATPGNNSSEIVTSVDRIFYLSYIELFNTSSSPYKNEGYQYPYYLVSSNRLKRAEGESNVNTYFTRSSYSGTTQFYGTSGNSAGITYADTRVGISCNFCL